MIAAALRDPEHDAVEFIWHGGETTALPISFYEKALLVQSRFRRDGQVVRNSLQTNGTLLDEDWARFLRANGFADVRISGACYHDVPAPLRPLDRILRHWPAGAAILLAHARKTG